MKLSMSNPGKCAYTCAPRVFGALSKRCKPSRPLYLLLGKGGRGEERGPFPFRFFSLSCLMVPPRRMYYSVVQGEPNSRGKQKMANFLIYLLLN